MAYAPRSALYQQLSAYVLTYAQLHANRYVIPNQQGASNFVLLCPPSPSNQPMGAHCCLRCKKHFAMSPAGPQPLQQNALCIFHPGKRQMVYDCCNSNNQTGCTSHNYHVHRENIDTFVLKEYSHRNGEYDVLYKTVSYQSSKHRDVVALDCEMVYTAGGLEVAKVTLMDEYGTTLVDTYVKPHNKVIDYNERFSGVSEDILNGTNHVAVNLHTVQMDLLQYIDQNTIIVGHSLESDLKALRIIHTCVVDTAVLYQEANGCKRKLKDLSENILKRVIQSDPNGHDSLEDARAAMDLARMLNTWGIPHASLHTVHYPTQCKELHIN